MSKALLKFVRVSPTKARLIAREVQGMNAELALAALEFMPNKAAGIVSKVIASAVANGDFEPEEVTITSCRVDKAAVMKRWRPRARGTASRIIKPTAHILVEVGTASLEELATKATAKKEVAKKEVAKKTAKKADTKKATPKKEAAKASKNKSATSLKSSDKPAAKNADSKKAETKKPVAKKAAPKAAAKSDAKGDDLTKVAGIGKVYQGKLNDEGIYTYADIVNMTQAQIDVMEEKYTFKGDFKDSIADAKNFVNGKDA
jgi:large subunit ribosomal protein L22